MNMTELILKLYEIAAENRVAISIDIQQCYGKSLAILRIMRGPIPYQDIIKRTFAIDDLKNSNLDIVLNTFKDMVNQLTS